MTFARSLILAGLVCGLIVTWENPRANSADPPAFGAAAATGGANEVTKFQGKLKGFQRGILAVTRDDGTDVMIQPPDDISAFTFVATAKPAFIQRGQLVRFTGMFQPNGVPTEPITKVEIFQPIQTQKVAGHNRDKFVPGVYSANRHAPKQPAAVGKYSVVGGVLGMNNAGVMMVQAGDKRVQVQLAQTVVFEVRYNNLTLAKEGDIVNVAGFYQPPDDTKVKADRVTVSTDRVYGETPAPTSRRRPTRTRRGDEAKKAAEGGPPPEGERPGEGKENGAAVEKKGGLAPKAE